MEVNLAALRFAKQNDLSVEVNLAAMRFAKQNDLSAEDYFGLMMENIDEVTNKRLGALRDIGKKKLRIAKFYNKKGPFEAISGWQLGLEGDTPSRLKES